MVRCFSMELRHLRYFCAVAEHESFTIAARQLNVSQSGVSGQVRDLEEEIGVNLFRRKHREVTLTPEGSVFLREAREILIRADRAVEVAVRSSRGVSGTLTVGLCGPVTAAFLPKLIRNFRKDFPGVTLALRELAPSAQIEALLNGHIDIAFTRGIPAEFKPSVYHELFLTEPLVVALPKGHPLASEQAIALNRLSKERLILYCREGAPEVFDAIVTMCKKKSFRPESEIHLVPGSQFSRWWKPMRAWHWFRHACNIYAPMTLSFGPWRTSVVRWTRYSHGVGMRAAVSWIPF